MPYSDESYNLRVEVDCKHCELPTSEREKMDAALSLLEKVVEHYPVSDLYITVIHHARSQDYHVKTALRLPGRTLFTGDRDEFPYPAFERCVRKLVQKVRAYEAQQGKDAELAKQAKGTHHEIVPAQEPSTEEINRAVQDGDYPAFRTGLYMYEEEVRKRAGRWVQRYPDFDAQIGNGITLEDIVEEVFLNAFESYERRPKEIRLGDWLEALIEPSIQAILRNPEEEKENIRFIKSTM